MSGTMGHSHSSSHKRLRSISSTTRNCGGEFTEIVDLEFSDAGTFAEAPNKPNKQEQKVEPLISSYPRELMLLEDHVKEVEQSIEKMSSDEFFVYFPSLKDDLHNCWQKVYGVREQNVETKLKKHKIIDHIRELLRKLNARLQRRDFSE